MKRRNGFTLAEVLIALTVIGVISAVTMPVLMQNTNKQETIAKIKKNYSILSQAYNNLLFQDPDIANWTQAGNNNCDSAKDIAEKFKPYLNIAKDYGCAYNGKYRLFKKGTYSLNGGSYYETIHSNGYHMFRLQDGTFILILSWLGSDNPKFEIAVIPDGEKAFKNPVLGKTLFYFYADKERLYPAEGICNKTSKEGSNGFGCTAWILKNENMDYPEN